MDPKERSRRAAGILDRYLGGHLLLPHLPGDPVSLIIGAVGSVSARRMLDELGVLYGVVAWDGASFRRHVLEDALPAWKHGSRVLADGDSLIVVAPGCPFREAVVRDPRICGLCKAGQVALVEQAVPGVKANVPGSVTDGLPACLLHVRDAEAPA